MLICLLSKKKNALFSLFTHRLCCFGAEKERKKKTNHNNTYIVCCGEVEQVNVRIASGVIIFLSFFFCGCSFQFFVILFIVDPCKKKKIITSNYDVRNRESDRQGQKSMAL